MNLLEQTLDMLANESRSREEIARDTGLGKEWLSKLSRGLITDPGVSKIERLHEYLKSNKAA